MMAEREKQDGMWLEPKIGAKTSDASGTQLVQREGPAFYPTSDTSK
jgi:hypothetical protein